MDWWDHGMFSGLCVVGICFLDKGLDLFSNRLWALSELSFET